MSKNVLVEITECEIEAIIQAKASFVTMAEFFKGEKDLKTAKETMRQVEALTRVIARYNVGITELLMKQEKMCPYGKKTKAQCTPSRARDCSRNHICGRNHES